MITDINSEDRLVQKTFADHLRDVLGWESIYAFIRNGVPVEWRDAGGETSINHAFHHNAFLVVSNGDRARYGSITNKWEHFTEWKRHDEKGKGRVDAHVLFDGVLAKERLPDLVENFILFDDSKPGGTRKIVARNHQVLGVNNAVASMQRQEELKREIPPERRLQYRVVEISRCQRKAACSNVARPCTLSASRRPFLR